jgi:hypothetical protein
MACAQQPRQPTPGRSAREAEVFDDSHINDLYVYVVYCICIWIHGGERGWRIIRGRGSLLMLLIFI